MYYGGAVIMATKLQNSEVRNALKLHTDLSEPQQR